MKLDQLKSIGAFINDKDLIKIPVEWVRKADDKVEAVNFEVYVKKLSFEVFSKINSFDDRNKTAVLISESVRFGENGDEQLTYQEALNLDVSLALAIDKAVNGHLNKGVGNG